MSPINSSGWSTPLSSTTTLASTPHLKNASDADAAILHNPRIQASNIIEHIASHTKSSSAVYVYDLAEQVGFGSLTKALSKAGGNTATVVELQTRAGAGLSLVGRLSQGTSHEAVKGAMLTAYTTPSGLGIMAPSFTYLPPALPSSRLVVQVPTVTAVGEALALSPSLAPLASVWPILPENLVVLLSATPQQSVDFATLSYKLIHSHVIHLFDHYSSSREYGHSITQLSEGRANASNVADTIRQAGYSYFDYHGDSQAHTVIVVLNGPLALATQTLVRQTSGLGVVVVNVLRPWDESALRQVLPSAVKTIHVLDDVPNEVTQGNLYVDVFGALWDGKSTYVIHQHRITPETLRHFLTTDNLFVHFISSIVPSSSKVPHTIHPPNVKKLLLFSSPQTPLSNLSHLIEDLFLSSKGISARLLTDYDSISRPGGVSANRLLLTPKNNAKDHIPIPISLPFDPKSTGEADFLGVLDQSLLKTHSVIKYAKRGSIILMVTTWTHEEIASNLPAEVVSMVIDRNLRIYTINAKNLASQIAGAPGPINDVVQNLLVHLSFLRLYLGTAAKEAAILKLTQNAWGSDIQGISLEKINARAWVGLDEIDTSTLASFDTSTTSLLKEFEFNSIAVQNDEVETLNGSRLGTWHEAAKHLLFPSIYTPPTQSLLEDGDFPRNPALRPEVPDRTFLVTCVVNKRLTPLEYDRNVFHLEFDTSGTGLKYAIGEALGVHGWNDEQEVLDFCKWYGVDPNRLITIPVPTDEGKMHTRTVLQALEQQVDLFGRPPKSFYTDLAAYATSSVEKHALLFIGSPEGASTFKKLSEKDTVTFADVLRKYSSAKPGIERLCEIVGDIKPRHYSIASAQSVVGDRVDLLVVTVDWMTPDGEQKFGQCTRYLVGLKVGQKVTVSIKPSVMKLPPSPKQPIIMAGLGTGAAPFRAFLQHLAMLASKGEEIGPVYYYFGSRHQASEYLYGEEIEAFILDGVVSRAGLAFSRDSAKKVYIQHKMLEDSEALADMLHDQQGVFYLCGPTWPVPDVYEALVNALGKYKGMEAVKAGEYLEDLKEEERYVLEVY